MVFNRDSIANFIYDLLKFEKVCKNDLEYAFHVFVKNQEYEKCSVIKELLELKYYDNRKRNNHESLLKVEDLIAELASGKLIFEKKEFIKQKRRIKKLKQVIEDFYDTMHDVDHKNKMVIPPFKREKTKEYFLTK